MVCDADPAPHSVDTPKEGEWGGRRFLDINNENLLLREKDNFSP